MNTSSSLLVANHGRQRGAAAVEFALVALTFFTLLIGILEFARVMYTWNTAVEATRRGARLAVVCDLNDAQVKTAMRNMVPMLATSDISISYLPSGCDVNSCQSVTVTILTAGQSASASTHYIPFLSAVWKIPPFSTTLTRESLQSGAGLDANPDC